ncbi:hypothetical protein N9O24_00755, partial [bacterium]|nr:hypothetical protein [bacterium]
VAARVKTERGHARRLQTLDENGDDDISGDEVVIFAENFAAQQVTLAEEHAHAEAAEAAADAFGAILVVGLRSQLLWSCLSSH